MKSTCYECQDRCSGCWSSCDRYIEAKKHHDALRKAAQKEKELYRELRSVSYGGRKR